MNISVVKRAHNICARNRNTIQNIERLSIIFSTERNLRKYWNNDMRLRKTAMPTQSDFSSANRRALCRKLHKSRPGSCFTDNARTIEVNGRNRIVYQYVCICNNGYSMQSWSRNAFETRRSFRRMKLAHSLLSFPVEFLRVPHFVA